MRNGFCFLTDRLPTQIGGLSIDTRACTAIAILLKLQSDAPSAEKASYMSVKLFGLPYTEAVEKTSFKDWEELDRNMVSYLSGAPQAKSWSELHPDPSKSPADGTSDEKHQTTPDFDFIQDSGCIISAFRQVYHLSLDEACDLHWWEFLELLHNLPPEGTMFGLKRSIRTRKPEPNATPEQKTALRKAKRSVALKDTRNPEQKRRDLQAQLDTIEL